MHVIFWERARISNQFLFNSFIKFMDFFMFEKFGKGEINNNICSRICYCNYEALKSMLNLSWLFLFLISFIFTRYIFIVAYLFFNNKFVFYFRRNITFYICTFFSMSQYSLFLFTIYNWSFKTTLHKKKHAGIIIYYKCGKINL